MVTNFTNNDVTNAEILEFLKENMVMNEDFQSVKADVGTLKENMATKADIARLDNRLAEMQLELERIRVKLDEVESRLKDDTDAFAQDILQLKSRVKVLEQRLGMQSASVVA